MKPTPRGRGTTGQDEEAIGPLRDQIVRIINPIQIEQTVAFADLIALAPGAQKVKDMPQSDE